MDHCRYLSFGFSIDLDTDDKVAVVTPGIRAESKLRNIL